MTAGPRFALYFAPPPESALWQFGSSVLGYDAASGLDVEQAVPSGIAPSEWRGLTEEPRRYGFHATLKAPFRLGDGVTETDLVDAVAAFAATASPFDLFLQVSRLGDFIALTPASPPPALAALESTVVLGFDRFRAPMEEEERKKRLQAPLKEGQRQHLERYGYPYVLDAFRFHMTLSFRLPANLIPVAMASLGADFVDQCPTVVAVDRLAVFREDGGRFRILTNVPWKERGQEGRSTSHSAAD